ncbi:MAG: ABC transporter permease [Longimicrobiales bacterium]|nr:ABC transporter permease [Longimicrobiales bacterium]
MSEYPRRRRVVSRGTIRDDVERELESHVQMRTDELMQDGWSREEAEAEARRLLGPRAEIARQCESISRSHERVARRWRAMDTVVQDLKYATRTLLRSPGFAVVAVVTLALGIGANTAIFSVVDGVLLEPLPYPDSDELVRVHERNRDGGPMNVAWANFQDWRSESTVFDGLFAFGIGQTTVLGGERPLTTGVATMTQAMWATLAVAPVQGRFTLPEDHVPGAAPVVVVREGFWRNELGARPMDGLRLELNGVTATVVGVAPESLDFPVGSSLWVPAEILGPMSTSRTAHNWRVVGRLSEGVSAEGAEEQVDGLTRRIVQSEPDADPDYLATGALVRPLQDVMVGSARAPLLLLLGAAGVVLLIACTNLASTLLARGANRSRELAVRSSLGAGRGRLLRQLTTESLVLAAGGAIAGVALGSLLVALLKRLGPGSVPRLQSVAIDGSVLLYAVALSAGTAVLFGLLPAARLVRRSPVDDLRQGGRGNALGGRSAAWTLLVGSEVALALVLLVASGLLVRSFRSALAVDAGFDASDVITAPLSLSRVKYETPAEHAAFYRRIVSDLAEEPAIESVGVLSVIPLGRFFPTGRVELDDDLEKQANAGYVLASPGAFQALDIPLLEGRAFTERDEAGAPWVAIVSRSFADEYWPGEPAVGRTVSGGGMDDLWEERPFSRVVGVVGDVRFQELTGEARPTVYFPLAQRPFRIQFGSTLVAESASGDAATVGPLLRSMLQEADPDIPVSLATQEEIVGSSLAGREFTMLLLAGFSILAVILAVVGIYGVVSYSVATRTKEMGIRLALGADRRGVVELVMKSAMGMVAVGLLVGGVAAYFTGSVVEGMLYEVGPRDPMTLLGGVALLTLAATLASWFPAYSGTRVDPMVTMRAE